MSLKRLWFFKFMLAAKVHVWFDLWDDDKIWHFSSLWFLSDTVWSKWATETSRNFLSGNIECYLTIGYLFLIWCLWNQSYISTWTSYSKSRGERPVERACPRCVSDQACPPIGEISRHRHRCHQALWHVIHASAVTLLNKDGYRRTCYR